MPLFPWFRPAPAGLALAVAVIAITSLALLPPPQVPISTGWDKLNHSLAFFVLAILADHTWPRRDFWRWSTLLLLAYGVGIEIAQSLTPNRDSSLLDILANGVGIVMYGLVRMWAGIRLAPASGD